MKKFLLCLILSVFLILGFTSSVFSQDDLQGFDQVFDSLFESREAFIEGFSFLSAYVTGTTQIGQFTMLDSATYNFGLTTNLALLDTVIVRTIAGEEASAAIDDIPLLNTTDELATIPMGNLYFGVKIPNLPLSFFLRGIWLPLATVPESQGQEPYFDDFFLIGGGACFDFGDLLPKNEDGSDHLLDIKLSANYHISGGIPYMNFQGFGANASIGFNLAGGIVVPYIGIGWNMSIIGVSADLWQIYDMWFNEAGNPIPTLGNVEDYMNDPRVPNYVKDRISSNVEGYGGTVTVDDQGNSDPSDDVYTVSGWGSATDDDAQNILTLYDTLPYAANVPLSIGVKFKLGVFLIGIEYCTSIPEIIKIGTENAALSGTISLTLGFGL